MNYWDIVESSAAKVIFEKKNNRQRHRQGFVEEKKIPLIYIKNTVVSKCISNKNMIIILGEYAVCLLCRRFRL